VHYTGGVNISVPLRPCMSRFPRAVLACLLAAASLVAEGCAAVWETGTPTPSLAATPAGTRAPYVVETRPLATATAQVTTTPTPFLASLVLSTDPVQSWTNPNDIQGLAFDGQYLWAATSGGVVRWNQDMSEYVLYTVSDGLVSPTTLGVAVDGGGDVWVAYAGLDVWSEYDGSTWATTARQDAVEAQYDELRTAQRFDYRMWAVSSQSGWLWMPTVDGQVRAYDGQVWRAYGPYEGVRRGIRFVAVSTEGRVWAVGDGVSTALEGYRWWEDHSLFSEIPDADSVTSVGIDPAGRLWIGFVGTRATGGGICSLDLEESRWTGYLASLNPSIPHQVYGMEILSDGTVWLCGEGAASCQRPGRAWLSISLPGMTAQALLVSPAGPLWLGTSHGIWVVAPDGRNPRGPWVVPTPFMGGQVLQLGVDAQGRLLIGTPQGLAYAVPGGTTGLLLAERPTSLAIGSDGTVWAGTSSGLYRLAPDGGSEQVGTESVQVVVLDGSGTPWLATTSGALLRYTAEGLQPVGGTGDLGAMDARDLAVAADGTLYIATGQGLGILGPDGSYTVVTVDDGLPDLDVRCLATGPEGELWVGTAHGLGRLQPAGRWTRLTVNSTEGGLRSEEIVDLHVDADGTLWIATSAGLSSRTSAADWSYIDIPGVQCVYPESSSAVWLGGQGGLYRVERSALVPVP